MNDENDIHDNILLTSPLVEEFNALEQLEEASASLGWNAQYQQRSKGNFKYRAMLKETSAGISLMREALNLNMEVVGEYPPELIVVAVPVKGGVLWGNGCTINDNQFLVLGSGQQAHFFTSAPADIVSVLISENSLLELSSKLGLMSDKPFVESTAVIQASPEKYQLLMQMADSILRSATDNLNTQEKIFRYLEYIALLMSEGAMDPVKVKNTRALEKWRVLHQTREYIEGHLDQPIQMAELCHYASVSLSKLERVYRTELQMPPLAYIKMRRLNKVRASLIRNAPLGQKISQLAMDHGFTHIGRFAAEYRDLFGRFPHEDQKAAAFINIYNDIK